MPAVFSWRTQNELRSHWVTLSQKVHVSTESEINVISLFHDTIQ